MVAERADTLPALGECFREHGYEGASLARLCAATGLGKGSLYHFFPGGKEEMAAAVLADIDAWFETHIFAPLEQAGEAHAAVAAMITQTDAYFRSGRRICLVGALGLTDSRDRFATPLSAYFRRWVATLARALTGGGLPADTARALAEECVAAIQGAIVLARATGEAASFARVTELSRRRLTAALDSADDPLAPAPGR